jgi:uncharacterized protein with von Willebrand factor type A (vWA) domain
MLIDFFYTLRAAKLPVSVKEFLTLLEALKLGVVGPKTPQTHDDDDDTPSGYKIDDFYFLSRATLVKDEKHYDKFDRAFAAYFKGVELVTDFTQEVPLDWLKKTLELNLTPRAKSRHREMGWDELMETLKKRLEEQKERHEGGSKWIGTGGTSPLRPWRLQPAGHPHRGERQEQKRGQGVGAARLPRLRRHPGVGHAKHQGGAASAAQICPRRASRTNWTWTTPSAALRPTPAGSTSRCARSATTTSRCCC